MRVMLVVACTLSASLAHAEDAGNPASERKSARLEEVIVTAQRGREEKLTETPISVGVLSGNELDQSSSRGIADVLNQVGGVSMTEIQPGRTDIVVRGVVPGIGTNTTAYYLDEVPFAFLRVSELPDSNAFDLARIEVLRGPQGTLYGANSLSGVVRVLTHDADLNDFEFKTRTRISDTEGAGQNYGADLAVNVPMIPGELAMRAVASYSDLSGFIDSTDSFSTPSVPHSGINDSTAQNYRFKLGWQPNDALRIRLSYARSDIENDAVSQGLDNLTTPFVFEASDVRVLDTYNLIAEYEWPSVSLLSSTGYIGYSVDTRPNLMLTSTLPLDYKYQLRLNSFTQEMRLLSHLQGPWQWSAGAFYSDSDQSTLQDARPNVIPSLQGVFIQGAISESYAAFGEATRSFAEGKFDVTAGLRYFNDSSTIQDISSFNPAAILVPDQDSEFDQVTGRVVFAYKPQADSMYYASVSTGFRSGMVQAPEVVRVAPSFPSLDPDDLTNYEIGAKARVGDRFTYETAVYYMDWSGIQQSLVLPIGFTARVNAGSASGIGVDASLAFEPGNGANLWVSAGWNDLQFDKDVFNFNAGQNRLLFAEGTRLNDSPEWTGAVGGGYRTPAFKDMEFVVSSSFAYSSKRLLRFLTGGVLRQTESDAMRVLKASVGFESARWSVDFYGDNLLNDDGAITAPDANVANTAVRQRPRTVGLQATYRLQN